MPNFAAQISRFQSLGLIPNGVAEVDAAPKAANTQYSATRPSGEPLILTNVACYGDGTNYGRAWFNMAGAVSGEILDVGYSIGVGDANFAGQFDISFVWTDDMTLYIRNEADSQQATGYSGVTWVPEVMGKDPVSAKQQMTGNTTWEITPPSGETWLITSIFTWGDGATPGWAGVGYTSGYVWYVLNPAYGIGQGDNNRSVLVDGRVIVDETSSLYIRNEKASTDYCAYSGIIWDK